MYVKITFNFSRWKAGVMIFLLLAHSSPSRLVRPLVRICMRGFTGGFLNCPDLSEKISFTKSGSHIITLGVGPAHRTHILPAETAPKSWMHITLTKLESQYMHTYHISALSDTWMARPVAQSDGWVRPWDVTALPWILESPLSCPRRVSCKGCLWCLAASVASPASWASTIVSKKLSSRSTGAKRVKKLLAKREVGMLPFFLLQL